MSYTACCSQLPSLFGTRLLAPLTHPSPRAVSLISAAPRLCWVTNCPISITDVVYDTALRAKNLWFHALDLLIHLFLPVKRFHFLH